MYLKYSGKVYFQASKGNKTCLRGAWKQLEENYWSLGKVG